jgi:hypothetical protein
MCLYLKSGVHDERSLRDVRNRASNDNIAFQFIEFSKDGLNQAGLSAPHLTHNSNQLARLHSDVDPVQDRLCVAGKHLACVRCIVCQQLLLIRGFPFPVLGFSLLARIRCGFVLKLPVAHADGAVCVLNTCFIQLSGQSNLNVVRVPRYFQGGHLSFGLWSSRQSSCRVRVHFLGQQETLHATVRKNTTGSMADETGTPKRKGVQGRVTLMRFTEMRASTRLDTTLGNMEMGKRRMLNNASDVKALKIAETSLHRNA